MSNNIRIRTTPNGNDKYLKVKLEQDFDFIEILSLKISQEDAYRRFCSDYGVVVGRVIVNGGFGVPNAKVSVFIPIDDVDKENPLISGLYPYELVTDKDDEGIRYNLLPRESETNNPCFTPVGTFPNKREVLDNEVMSDVYCKYYKFTTTTNFAGDFMIFGVPVGTHTIHVDVDMSDIGTFSQRPYDLINQGAPEKLFDSSTKFSGGKNLDKLPQIKTANVGVNVQPFWGDLDSCQVGISRIDVDLNYNLIPTAIFTGSIFGDQDKDSVNKNCAPRQGMGEFCQQVTGKGTIEILRKTFEGETELFYVEGGQVIDDNGVWAFQIPMNLDYVTTSEDGTLVPYNGTDKGVPTRTRARFRVGMDETGDNGRLRTRAKYLVPNNPQTDAQIDYSFNENTKETSFRDMFWNKIYSVSNFISRYQKVKINTPGLVSTVAETTSPIGGFLPSRGRTRNFIGIKNVDECVGQNTPFPYNRVNTKTNPLFFVICLLLKYVIFIIALINSVILPIINRVIQVINGVINVLNSVIDAVNTIPFVDINHIDNVPYRGCITIECPNGSGVYFAPGCSSANIIDGGLSLDATDPTPNFYCQGNCALFDSVGLDDCIAFQLASELNMYEFDFYNDWINGTLYSFLLKYKAKKNGKEKFCDYDCQDFDSSSDSDCNNQLLVDVMLPEFGNANSQDVVVNTGVVREGVVKKVDENLYYAATQHNAQAKLFATEIICLGSVFDCDWQGLPKIAQYFRPSSYQIPPVVPEFNDDGTIIEETGIVSLNDQADGLFFKINCSGLHVNAQQALNIRHACEIFVDLDVTSDDGIAPDGVIGSNDITEIGTDVRDIFVKLNSGTTGPNVNFNNVSTYDDTIINTAFNLSNFGEYDFTSPTQNGQQYIDFRGYYTYNTDTYTQPKFHSFFTYFGLVPNQSAIDILNRKYLGVCTPVVKPRFVISTTVTPDILNLNEGIIEFTILGSVGPYTYTVTNGQGYESTGTIGVTPPTVVITGLEVGTYTITVLDALGNPVITTASVTGQQPLFCDVYVSQTDTSASGDNGQITIASVGGGVGPYTFEVEDSLGNPAGNPTSGTLTTLPLIINDLGPEPTGYFVTITDSTGNGCVTENLVMSGVYPLALTVSQTQPTCYNSTNGEITSVVTGGVAPYTIHVTGPSTDDYGNNITGLGIGNYTISVVDFLGNTISTNSTLTSLHPYLEIAKASSAELAMQCSATYYYVKFYVLSGIAPGSNAYVTYQLDNSATYNVTIPFVNSSTPLVIQVADSILNNNIKISISDSPDHACNSNQIIINESEIALPNQVLTGNITTTPSGNIFNPYHHVININGGFAPYVISPINDDDYIDNNVTSTRTITDSVGCSITITG